MIFEPSAEDIAEARKQGDLKDLLLVAAGLTLSAPKRPKTEPEKPCYHISRSGAWPCGTAASGPSPGPFCPECQPQQEGTP